MNEVLASGRATQPSGMKELLQPAQDRVKPLVILISYYFPPSPAVGGLRPFRFQKYLSRQGYDCRIVTATSGAASLGHNVYEVSDTAAEWRMQGKTNREWRLDGEFERFLRRFVLPGHEGFAWAVRAAKECARISRSFQGPTVVISSFPPIGTHAAGLLAKREANVSWIADFRDPMNMGSTEIGAGRTMVRLLSFLEQKMFREADAIISNVEAAAEHWRRIYPWATDKLSVIWNGYDPEEEIGAKPLPQRKQRVLLHAGNLYGGRNANSLISLLGRLRSRRVPEVADVELQLLGGVGSLAGVDAALTEQAEQEGWLRRLPPVSPAEALSQSQTADGLVLLQPHTAVQVPAKLFQYVCVGRPVVAVAQPNSAVEKILTGSGIPHVCLYPDGSIEENEQKLISYLRLPSDPTPPSTWFKETFDARQQAVALSAIVDSVAGIQSQVQLS